MGRVTLEIQATASVSNHNSPQDDIDRAAWNRFVAAVDRAARDNALEIDLWGDRDLPTRNYS